MTKKIIGVGLGVIVLAVLYIGFDLKTKHGQGTNSIATSTTPTTSGNGATGTINIEKVPQIGVLTGHITTGGKPYAIPLNIVSIDNGQIVQVHADMTGKFYAPLPQGQYRLMDASANLHPKCSDKTATITDGKITTVDISCDNATQ